MSRRRKPKFRLPFELEWERHACAEYRRCKDEEGNEHIEETGGESWPNWYVYAVERGRRLSQVATVYCQSPFCHEVSIYGVEFNWMRVTAGTLWEAGQLIADTIATKLGEKESTEALKMLRTLAKEAELAA